MEVWSVSANFGERDWDPRQRWWPNTVFVQAPGPRWTMLVYVQPHALNPRRWAWQRICAYIPGEVNIRWTRGKPRRYGFASATCFPCWLRPIAATTSG